MPSEITQGPSESSSAPPSSHRHGQGHIKDAGEDTTPTSSESDQTTSTSKISSPVTPTRGTHTGTVPLISIHIPSLSSIIHAPAVVQTSTSTVASPNEGGRTTRTNPKSPQEKPTRGPQLKDPIHFSDLPDPIAQRSTEIQVPNPPSSSTSSGQNFSTESSNTAADTHNHQPPPTSPAPTPPPQTITQGPKRVPTATSSANPPPSLIPSGKGNNGDGSPSGEGPSSQDPGVTDSSTPAQTRSSGNQGSSLTPAVPGSSSTPTSSSGGKPNGGPALGHGSSTTANSTPNSTKVPDGDGTTPNGTPASKGPPLPVSTSTGGPDATPNDVGPTDHPGPMSSGVAHPPNAPSHSESGVPQGTGGPTTAHTPIGLTTASDHHTSSSATAEPSISPSSSSIAVLALDSEDGEFSTYTTTITSLETFFELMTITTSPPPTTFTTSTPYSTSTELITSTIVISVTTTARSSFRPSKAQLGGIVAGSVGFFALLVAILIYLIRRKRKRMDFVLVSPNDTPYPESDAEMGESGHGHNLRQQTIQTLPGKASISDSDSLVLPPRGRLGYDTLGLSDFPSTLSFQQPSHRVTIDSTDNSSTMYWRSYSVDTANYSGEGYSVESDSPRKTHQGDLPFQPVPHKSPTDMNHNSVSSDFRYGYAV